MTIIKDGYKAAVINEGTHKGGVETSSWQSSTSFCALPASGAARGSSSCHKGYRDNEWIFIKCSKYALITLIGLLWFQLWQNFISVQVTFASGLVPAGKEKAKSLLKRAEDPLISWSAAPHRAPGRLMANNIPHLVRDF